MFVLLRDYVNKNGYGENAFVHTRVKAYLKNNIDVKVFVLNPIKEFYTYEAEGVCVFVGNKKDFKRITNGIAELSICIHFIDSIIIDCIKNVDNISRAIVFVHGYEALHWYQRVFPGTFTHPKVFLNFLHYIRTNNHELPIIRRFLSETNLNVEFVAVSKWMADIAEKVWRCEGRLKWIIIPNYIESDMFSFEEKPDYLRTRLLSIRSFATGKYANDLTVRIIKRLKRESFFDRLSFTLVGQGLLFRRTTGKVRRYKNIRLENRAMPHSEIKKYHKGNGVFLCPTRQDAQGVSMCEAMSSGLVPITLYNTAIPEFLPDDSNLKCYNVKDMEKLVINLIEDPKLFKTLSLKCSKFIQEKCSYENTIQKEIDLFNNN